MISMRYTKRKELNAVDYSCVHVPVGFPENHVPVGFPENHVPVRWEDRT